MVAVREAEERLWHFGEFILDVDNRLLLRDGEPIAIGPKAFDLLLVLLDRRGKILSKQFLLDTVWPDAIVDINNLNQQIAALRKALDDGRFGWIETIPRVGFRFRPETHPLVSTPRWTRRHSGAVAAIGIAALLATAVLVLRELRGSHTNVRSVAVLPLRAEKTTDSYLGMAIADALTGRLAESKQVSARPVTAVSRYADRRIDPRAAGKELQVDSVITGTVKREAHTITATVQIVRVLDGKELWRGRFTSPTERLFSLPDEIYSAIAREINLPVAVRTVRHQPPPAAFEAYAEGVYFFRRRTTADLRRAESSFRTALAIDPGYAEAWAGLSDALGFLGQHGESASANQRALELDDTLVQAHANLALGILLGQYNFDASRREFERALAIDPGDPVTHHWYAYYFVAIGDFDRALAEMAIARRADPSSLIILADTGNILFRARRYDQAIARFKELIRTDPTFAQGHSDLALAYQMTGRYDDAIHEMRLACELNDDNTRRVMLAQAYAAAGKKQEARTLLEQSGNDVDPSYLCMAYATLGEKEKALDYLQRAFDYPSAEVALLQAHPLFDPLRNEPRFTAIVHRIRQ